MSPDWDRLTLGLNGSSQAFALPVTAIGLQLIAYLCLEQVRNGDHPVAAINLGVQGSAGQDMDMDQGELEAFVDVF